MYFIMILAAKGGGGVTNHRPPNLSFEKFRIFFSGGDFSWEGGGTLLKIIIKLSRTLHDKGEP